MTFHDEDLTFFPNFGIASLFPPCFFYNIGKSDRWRQCSISGRCSNRVDTGRCTSNTVRPCTLVTAGKPDTFYLKLEKQRVTRVQNNMSMSYYFVDGYQVPVTPFSNLTVTITTILARLLSSLYCNILFRNLLFLPKSVLFISVLFCK